MTPTVSQIISLIKIAQDLWKVLKDSGLLDRIGDRQVAVASMEMLQSTDAGKDLLERIAALPEEEADKLWEAMLAHGQTGKEEPVEIGTEVLKEPPKQETKTSGK